MKCLFSLLLAFPLALTFSGCDWGPTSGKDDPLATEILEVKVEPNPVVVGGTTTFTVVIKDSTKTGFVYTWSLPLKAESTKEPSYTWIAPDEPREYSLSVQVSREGAYTPVQRGFKVKVVAP